MNLREAAGQALEALLIWQDSLTNPDAQPGWRFFVVGEKAIANLRAALAEDVPETNFGNITQTVDSKESDHVADTGKTSDHFADAGEMVATSRESRQVEPVATINEMETVDPVAWLIESYDIYAKRTLQRLVFDNPKNMQGVKITAYYTAPPKREPLTEEQICEIFISHGRDKETFARAIVRAAAEIGRGMK